MFRNILILLSFWMFVEAIQIGLAQEQQEQVDESDVVEDVQKSETVNPFFERLVPPDRITLRRYDQTGRLIEAGKLAEAAQLLGTILENPVDYFVPPNIQPDIQPDIQPPNFSSQTSNKLFGNLVLERLQGLPRKALESYSLQFEAQARRLLENAVQNGSIEEIQLVSKLYFPTTSGATASFLLGIDQFEHGAYETAMLTLQRLNQSRHDLTPFEPVLSLTLASTQLRFQQKDQARQTIEQLLKRYPTPTILFFGNELWKPKSTDEIIARLETLIEESKTNQSKAHSTALWLEQTGWLLGMGTPSQNTETLTQKPLLELIWSVPILNKLIFNWEADNLLNLVQNSSDTYIPAAQPLIVDDRLLTRGMNEITAVDRQTGKQLWTATETEYRISKKIQLPFSMNMNTARISSQNYRGLLRLFFWHDRITHQMSSDGSRLFTVDGLDMRSLAYAALGRGVRNLQIGKKSIEDPRWGPGNTLVARDVKTGQILWQIGKFPYVQKRFDQYVEEFEPEQKKKEPQNSSSSTKNLNENTNNNANDNINKNTNENSQTVAKQNDHFTEEELFFSETWFLGAPLPFRGRLHVIGENGGVVRLMVLDAESGRLIRQQPLGIPENPFEMDPLRKYYGLIPSASNGLILCPTGIGFVVALDVATMTPVWCFSYLATEKENGNTRNQFRPMRNQFGGMVHGQNDEFRRLFAFTGWQVPTLMIDNNRILVAPPDDPALYCLDLLTGKLLWQKKELKHEHALYVACIRNETAYIVTPRSMLALNMETGEPVWEFSLTAVSPPKEQLQQQFPKQSHEHPDTELANAQTSSETNTKPNLCFPHALKPNGIGVHNGNQYFLPFTDGYLGMIDLDRGTMEIMSSQLVSQTSSTIIESKKDSKRNESDSDFGTELLSLRGGNFPLFSTGREINDPVYNSLLRQEITLGNLIGFRGRFFSQTPNRILCFDQLEPLKEEATNRLKVNPNDAEGLLQLGRVRRAEGNIAESIALFRRSLQSQYSEYTTDCLRKTLLEAIRNDYSAWSSAGSELEALAEFPEELGEILFARAQGALQNSETDKLTESIKLTELTELLQKVFYLESEHSVQVPVNHELSSQLHRILGTMLEQSLKSNKNPELKNSINRVAELIFQQLQDEKIPAQFVAKIKADNHSEWTKKQILLRPWWEQESMLLFPEIRCWQVFTELFQQVPIFEQAEKKLREQYERHHFFSALELAWNFPAEWFLPEKFFESKNKKNATDSSVVSNSSNIAPSAQTTVSQIPTFDFEKTHYLATLLESQGNIADAVYYYRILEKYHKEQGQQPKQNIWEKPKFKEFYEQEIQTVNWREGDVLIEDDPQTGISWQPSQQGQNAVTRILRAAQPRHRFTANQQYSLPFLGSYEPFLSPYSYSLETIQPDVFLVCYDRSGNERWRSCLSGIYSDMMDYGFFNENSSHYSYGFSDQTVYLKGCNHVLLFVRDNEMIAFDTFRCNLEDSPKILWTKTLSSILPSRQMSGSVALSNFQIRTTPSDRRFPKESLFVSPQVVCYCDAGYVYGLHPMTGQTLWTRKIASTSCSILGDRENLFLIFPDTHQAIAIDPLVGRELASGTIPHGGIMAFETNIVFLKRVSSLPATSNSSHNFQLYLSDLRELFQKRRRALIVTDDTESGMIPSIPTYPIGDHFSHESMVRSICSGRFLAIVSWTSKMLRIYDLQTKRDIFGAENDWGVRTGAVLSGLTLREPSRQHDCDFDVELLGDQFLVYFTESGEVNLRSSDEMEDGVLFKRRRSPVVNVHARPVGSGYMMLYDLDGKPCWTQPVGIDDWYRLLRVPPNVPVALFAVMFNEEVSGQPTISSTALLGIDKRTGKTRFRALIPPLQRPLLQGFRLTVDLNNQKISFLAPGRTVHVKFTDQTKTPPPKTEKTVSPLNKLSHEWLELFQ
ncbi:MAG: PQQ-binding-like beta-propeller repeat protein [Planctomycetaceae bacterium]|jgi:outer membrane protein assembly factor BamB/predicted negative regulator of RcsB-dependent stress response|nr:PQQ-binding-like beta-propeller repeat protein [Planctomycetaceae bacterium]